MTAEADALKAKGNASFQEGHYQDAIDDYTDALSLTQTAVLYSNRAAAYLRLELAGAALADANAAIGIDPSFVKGYYRKASAHIMLGKLKEAQKDLKTVVERVPNDPEPRLKYDQVSKEVYRIRFAEAIASESSAPMSERLQCDKIPIPSNYDGPIIEGGVLTLKYVEAMMERFRSEKLIARRDLVFIIKAALEIFRKLPNIVSIPLAGDDTITVCGDTHGQYYDLLNLFRINGIPSPDNMYLFNGDFVDRGSYSLEVVTTLLAFKVLYPNRFFMSRGNHEGRQMNMVYGFDGEVRHKYDEAIVALYQELFDALPTGHLIHDRIFVVHGGLYSQDGVTIEDLQKPNRFGDIPSEGLLCESLWSDPQPMPGRGVSKRGVGCSFGPDVTAAFLARNGLSLLIRSHEVKMEGYEVEQGGLCITVFSAPNYCDQVGNKAAFIRLSGKDLTPRFTSYEAVPHPGKKPMQYSSALAGMM